MFFSQDKYSTNLTINDESGDGVLGAQTWGGRMVGADKSTELWWHPICFFFDLGRRMKKTGTVCKFKILFNETTNLV